MEIASWIRATRPKTLSASQVPVITATALSYQSTGRFSLLILLCSAMTALLIQIATNLINDAYDFENGVDTKERIGPVRVTQAGLLTSREVLQVGFALLLLSLLFAMPLIYLGGPLIGLIWVLSAYFAYGYTGGPFPLSYLGFGDLFVFLFFGLASTLCVFYLQAGLLSLGAVFMASQIGFFSTVLIAINNLRDVYTDPAAGKLTLPVRFGIRFGRWEISLLLLLGYLCSLYWIAYAPSRLGLLLLIPAPLAAQIVKAIWQNEPSPLFNRTLALSSLHLLLFAALLSLLLLFS